MLTVRAIRNARARRCIGTKAYSTGQNMVEKIVQKYVVNQSEKVKAGQYVTIQPAHVMTHDNTSAVISKFVSIQSNAAFKNNTQPVFTLDHNVQDKSKENLAQYQKIEDFAKKHKIDFYPAGRGIGHQIMCEEGYAFPGTLVVASDSHSNMYGGLGCLGTPVVRTDAAGIWATGKTWWKVPLVTKVTLEGKLRGGATGKDVIITLCGFFNNDEVLNHAVEFSGPGVESLSIDDRLTIANMTTEWGALVGLFPVDNNTLNWLNQRMEFNFNRKKENNRITEHTIAQLKQNISNGLINADTGAPYYQQIVLDLGAVEPHVSGPNHVKVMKRVSDIEKQKLKINKAYIVSCVNSRVSDLSSAASVLRGKKIAPHVQLYIAAASSEVEAESVARGDWEALVSAGARTLPPGCGPCIGLGTGLLEDGEVGISATNRNFKGRMGSRNAEAYLASPAVVAESALRGYIASPFAQSNTTTTKPPATITKSQQQEQSQSSAPIKIVSGFPNNINGSLIFCNQDNINTDGIYPGKYTYIEMTPEKQAKVVMENYDPQFNTVANAGDVVVAGYNFGTGSSREQAATAFKYKGISLVIAGSFSETYLRNAINNGYICIEVPELVDDLRKVLSSDSRLTIKTEWDINVDFSKSTVSLSKKSEPQQKQRIYSFSAVGPAAQEVIVAGGLENWIRANLSK